MEDRIAIEELRRGAPRAAERLIQQHNRALWRIARSILRDDRDAEEVVQEAYLLAFSRIANSAVNRAWAPGSPASPSTRHCDGSKRDG
jgi:DNA-directed RNA polymerase specialized sigma24 family protein